MTYFAFTTLATIGFGDINPRGDIERIYGIFVFLFGVAVFTVILTLFTDIINEFRKFTSDEHLDGNLQQFFDTLRRFNNQEMIDINLRVTIEKHLNLH